MSNEPVPANIPGDCKAYRLVKPEWVKRHLSPPAPSSQAFQDHPQSGAMSVWLEDEIEAAGRVVAEILKSWPGYWIYSLTVDDLRGEFGQDVERAPVADFPGHALVREPSGKRNQGKRSKMAARSVLEVEGSAPTELAVEASPLEPRPADRHTGQLRQWWRRLWPIHREP